MRQIAIALLLLAGIAEAKPIITAICEEPVGTRFDQENGVIHTKADGFSGVKPVFILDDEKPNSLTFLWGPADWAKKEIGAKQNALDATIISVTGDKITAVRVENAGVTQMYSLYPKKGLVFFTQHRYIPVAGGVPTASTFYSKCTFNSTQ